METRTLRSYIVVVGLMVATSLALAVSVDVSITDEAGIRMELPESFGDWDGSKILFCHRPECQASFLVRDLESTEACPRCEAEGLKTISKMEADILPADTGMLKMQYRHAAGRMVNVGIVLSAKERGSIHRPEVCQTGQGRDLVDKQVIEVPIEGRSKPLKVMVLELERMAKTQDGKEVKVGSYYTYWFIGKDRETPHHHMRMFLMAADRITRNVAHRWAYISVSGTREIGSDDHHAEIKEVIAELYPVMKINQS